MSGAADGLRGVREKLESLVPALVRLKSERDGLRQQVLQLQAELAANAAEHVNYYVAGIDDRLTGQHETAPWSEFSYGVSDRGASVRIPWQVEVDGKGYLEDRRPNANCDPYIVTRLIVDTCCSALAG